MKIAISILFINLILLSCNTQKKKNVSVEKLKAKIEIVTETISNSEIKATIKTNLPENTNLTITASRDYKRKNDNAQYAGDLYYSFSSPVKNGKISFNFNPLSKKWIDEYEIFRKENGEFDKTLTEIDNKSIEDTIEISVLYTPKAKQPEDIIKKLGSNGENLIGKEIETTSSGFKICSKKIKLYNQFKK